MSGARTEGFPAKVARECEDAAERLCRLQAVIGDATRAGTLSDRLDTRLLVEMQALDAVCQTLDGLAALFGRLEEEPGHCWTGIPPGVLECVSQTTLRDRLNGQPQQTDVSDVDLF